VPLEVLQQLLGHSSLSTTTIYMSTERDRMVRELRKRKPRVAA
jgi:site-specific recombinase XerD